MIVYRLTGQLGPEDSNTVIWVRNKVTALKAAKKFASDEETAPNGITVDKCILPDEMRTKDLVVACLNQQGFIEDEEFVCRFVAVEDEELNVA